MKTLFPYDVLFGDVSVAITEVAIDDRPIFGRVDADRHEVDLSRLDRADWERAQITVALSAPPSELTRYSDVATLLVLNCGHSNTRVAGPLEADPDAPGRWHGSAELERDNWFGRATLRASVTATVDGVTNRIIGSSSDWTIAFDDLPRAPVTGSITIRWVDFGQPDEDARHLKHYATDPWYLRIDPDEPTLFLNRGFEGLEALLTDRRRRPDPERALHNHARASLASEVWLTLFNAALDATVVDDDGMVVWPPEDWQKSVLSSLLNRMYDDKSGDDALMEAFISRQSADGAATLHERLLPAAVSQVRLPRLLREGIRLLGSEPVDVEEVDQ